MGRPPWRRPHGQAGGACRRFRPRADPRHGDRNRRQRAADHLRARPQPDLLRLRRRAGLSARANHLVAGMCETDYSGYPDCRDDTIKAMQVALGLGMDRRFVLHTPLMWIDKAGTFALAESIGGKALLDLVIEATHSCYLGDRTHRHDWGYGCGTCPACKLRADGFAGFVQERR